MNLDESRNLPSREGKRYRAIRKYVAENYHRCLLHLATPYNEGCPAFLAPVMLMSSLQALFCGQKILKRASRWGGR